MSLNATACRQVEEKRSWTEPSWRDSTNADERRASLILFLIGERKVRTKVKIL